MTAVVDLRQCGSALNHERSSTRGSVIPMLQRCSSSLRPMPLRSAPSTSSGRIRGRGRAAPAVFGHHRQRAGAGVRPHHRRLEAAAAATGEAGAAVTSGALTRVVALRQQQLEGRLSVSDGAGWPGRPASRQLLVLRRSAQLLQLVSQPAHGRSRVVMGVCAAHFRTWAPQARSCSGVVTGDWRNMICWSYNEAPGPCHFILPVAKHEGMATLFGWSQIRR